VGARILVVEDDADIRRLVVVALKRAGHTVLEAADGDAALALIEGQPPDLAVLDIMLPGRSGLDIVRTLRAQPSTANLPFMIISARGQANEVAAGLADGAQDYLVKPFAPADLVRRVAKVLSSN
jgi:DNA-binding response OmpR family regulator